MVTSNSPSFQERKMGKFNIKFCIVEYGTVQRVGFDQLLLSMLKVLHWSQSSAYLQNSPYYAWKHN